MAEKEGSETGIRPDDELRPQSDTPSDTGSGKAPKPSIAGDQSALRNFSDEYFYHEGRATEEQELADRADDSEAASRHRDLSKLHRARRSRLEFIDSTSGSKTAAPGPVDRADKES